MMILDSSVWVALFSERDSQYHKALKIAPSFKSVAITEYIVLETSTLLFAKAGKETAEKFFEYALNNKEVELLFSSQDMFYGTLQLFRKAKDKKLSFVDTSLLYLSSEHEVITFDKELGKAIKKHAKAY